MRFVERAPAKLNLRLRFVGRRADGFHLLSMVNCVTSLVDTISIERAERPGIVFSVSGSLAAHPALALGPNLVVQAVEKFCAAFGLSDGFHVNLVKEIPIGSGLGGGSSDAAAALRALVKMFRCGDHSAAAERLSQCALALGADVPFFLHGGSAIVGGIGERVAPLNPDPFAGSEAAILVPSVAVDTKRAYALVREALPTLPTVTDEGVQEILKGWNSAVCADARRALVQNDFESHIAAAFPAVGALLQTLRESADLVVGMTGSGSAVFCLPISGVSLASETRSWLKRLATQSSAQLFFVRLGDQASDNIGFESL